MRRDRERTGVEAHARHPGFVDVAEEQRNAALQLLDGEPDPFAVAVFLGSCLAPLSLQAPRDA